MSRKMISVVSAGLFAGLSYGYRNMAESNGGRGGGRQTSPPPNAPQIPGLTWEEFDVRTAIVDEQTGKSTGKTKVIGQVKTPNFDEENPDNGIKQLAAFPFAEFSNGKFRDFKHAIVAMVNTQFGTHLRNWKRQEANPRLTAQQLELETLRRLDPAKMAEALDPTRGGGPEKFIALKASVAEQIKAEWKAKYGGGATVQAEGTGESQEEADNEAVTAASGVTA